MMKLAKRQIDKSSEVSSVRVDKNKKHVMRFNYVYNYSLDFYDVCHFYRSCYRVWTLLCNQLSFLPTQFRSFLILWFSIKFILFSKKNLLARPPHYYWYNCTRQLLLQSNKAIFQVHNSICPDLTFPINYPSPA